jgi:hypothetical protein
MVEVKAVRRPKQGMTGLSCRGGEGHEPVTVSQAPFSTSRVRIFRVAMPRVVKELAVGRGH